MCRHLDSCIRHFLFICLKMALCISGSKKMENICRLCLKQDEIMSPIFYTIDGENNYDLFAERITSIAHVEIRNDDGLPSTICRTCKNLVEQFHEFRVQVEISDKALRSYFKTPQYSAQHVNNLSDMNNDSTREMIYALLMPGNEHVQIWDVSDILQNTEQLNKIIKSEYINNQESIEDNEEVALNENDISCQLCSISFTSVLELKNHVAEHCSITEKQMFDDKSVHNPNAIEENTIDNQRVDIPNKQDDKQCSNHIDGINMINNPIHKNDELQKILNCQKLKCKYCNKSFSKVTFIMHNEKCRFREKELVCDECGKQFTKRSELRYHKGTHLTKPLTCEYCKKQFRNVQSFSIHLKRHTHGTRYHCETCGKSYYTNSELARHVQMHLEKRKHPCHLCDMSFMSQPELNRHLKYHNGLKRFECNICAKSYYESGHLKVHQRIHTGERPFVCQICNKGFVTRSKLVRHAKIHEK